RKCGGMGLSSRATKLPKKKESERELRPDSVWCERRDLNPYGITTRPSNVRVCRFRHSRRVRCSFATVIIIAKVSCGVKGFFQKKRSCFCLRGSSFGCAF